MLADASHREHLVAQRPKDWDGFFAAAGADAPIADGILLVRRLAAEHEVVLLSGRPERIRSVTEEWLDRHEVPRDRLWLRADDDHRPASRFKTEALRALGRPDRVAVVVDDDPDVVQALSRIGYRAMLYPERPER